MVTDDLGFIFQGLEEGISEGGQLNRFFGNELSKIIAHGIATEKRYWEKIQTFDETGERIFKIHVYSLVSIKESMLKKLVKRAMDKVDKISPEMKKKASEILDAQITKLRQG